MNNTDKIRSEETRCAGQGVQQCSVPHTRQLLVANLRHFSLEKRFPRVHLNNLENATDRHKPLNQKLQIRVHSQVGSGRVASGPLIENENNCNVSVITTGIPASDISSSRNRQITY